MERMFYFPKDALNDISIFFALDGAEMVTLSHIFTNDAHETIVDIYIAIMNELNVDDRDAESIFSIYKYILLVLEEKSVNFSQIIPELKYIFETYDIQNSDVLIKNINENSDDFAKVFSAGSPEQKHIKKRHLSSGVYNTVVGIQSICDIRPIFDKERDNIEDCISSIYIEFAVNDSFDNIKSIPLSFDQESFNKLKLEIEKIDKKEIVIEKIISRVGDLSL